MFDVRRPAALGHTLRGRLVAGLVLGACHTYPAQARMLRPRATRSATA